MTVQLTAGDLGGRKVRKTAERPTPERTALVSRLALGVDEAAAALGVSRDYLDEHIASELRWVRRGRRKLVAIKELERWLEQSAARTLEVT